MLWLSERILCFVSLFQIGATNNAKLECTLNGGVYILAWSLLRLLPFINLS